MTNWEKAWAEVLTLGPIIDAAKDEADSLRRLPDAITRGFLERDVYRLLLPIDLGGAGLDLLQQFELTLEVSRHDGSTGWNYALGSGGGLYAGLLSPSAAREIFATPDCGMAGSIAPQGRALATEGGYRLAGQFAWASAIHQSRWVMAGCVVFDGEKPRLGPEGRPIVIHPLLPVEQVEVLDTWHTLGLRGTGSTEFRLDDVFVPEDRALRLFGGTPTRPDPLFKLPVRFAAYGLSAVPLGVALSTIDALKDLAKSKKPQPLQPPMADRPSVHHTIGKAEAMVEAALLAARATAARGLRELYEDGAITLESRARLHGALVHAVETSIEAVSMCHREAGGSGVYQSKPFERALRDVHVVGGHGVFQRSMMEDVGRVALGLGSQLGI